MKTWICTKCNKEKELILENFSRRANTFGWQKQCKKCLNLLSIQYARRDYDKEKEHQKYLLRKAKGKHIESERRQRARFPEKYKARYTLRHAVKKGDVVKTTCEVCNNPVVEAHHDDYSKPLDVRWLCRKHHGLHHRRSLLTDKE